jgi:hypothetical protein
MHNAMLEDNEMQSTESFVFAMGCSLALGLVLLVGLGIIIKRRAENHLSNEADLESLSQPPVMYTRDTARVIRVRSPPVYYSTDSLPTYAAAVYLADGVIEAPPPAYLGPVGCRGMGWVGMRIQDEP